MHLRITSRWEAHEACDADISHLISIQNPDADLSALRPDSIAPEAHLVLLFEDLLDPDDINGPKEKHVQLLVKWLRSLDPSSITGVVVHCDAGVSRSTATAWLTMLILEPDAEPLDHLERVAKCAGRSYCWPSNLVTALGDRALEREGALEEILRSWKRSLRDRKW